MLTADTTRSFLPVRGDDNGDLDPVGDRLDKTSNGKTERHRV